MQFIANRYTVLARLKARYELEKNNNTAILIKEWYERDRKKRQDLLVMYNYIPEKHVHLFSTHTIAKSEGCGCEYCKALHTYANAKLHLHYFKKSFYADNGIDSLMSFKENVIPLRDNFYASYSEYTAKAETDELLSQADFFSIEYEHRKEKVKELRSRYKAIHEAIQTILSR